MKNNNKSTYSPVATRKYLKRIRRTTARLSDTRLDN